MTRIMLGLFFFLAGCLLPAVTSRAQQQGEDCDYPRDLRVLVNHEELSHVELDTAGYRNDIDGYGSGDGEVVASGPDLVLSFDGLVMGTYLSVNWTADYDAVVTFSLDDCDSSYVYQGVGTEGSLLYETPYHYPPDQFGWRDHYLMIDGLDGASGRVSMEILFQQGDPVERNSWGRIKTRDYGSR
jgi:hypothetical protein